MSIRLGVFGFGFLGRGLLGRGLLAIVFAIPVAAQSQADLLHYTFQSGTGAKVKNYGTSPGQAVIKKVGAQRNLRVAGKPDARGVRDFALAGSEDGSVAKSSYLDTGWHGDLSGDLTLAWHMKRSSVPGDASKAYYILSGLGGFRLYHDGNAYLGLKLKSWGGAPTELTLGSGMPGRGAGAIDLGAMCTRNWVHFALVIDEPGKTAVFYLNGKPVKSTAITGGARIRRSTSSTFRVGMHLLTSQTSSFDIDNFRLSNRAVPAAEIVRWAAAAVIPDRFDVSRTGGVQQLSIDAGPAYAGKNYIVFGAATGGVPGITLHGIHLPLNYDVYTELTIFANPAVFRGFRGRLDARGRGRASIHVAAAGVPQSLVGLSLLHAVLVYDRAGPWLTATNATPLVIFP